MISKKLKKNLKIHAFVQARQTSSRLPNKIFLKLNSLSVLENIYLRLNNSKLLDDIFFLIPSNYKNSFLKKYLKKRKYLTFYGSENNVLDRFYKASNKFKSDIIVRVTADCPLVDYRLMDTMIKKFLNFKDIDYYSNTIKRSFPKGLDIEIFSKKSLKIAIRKVNKSFDREHVTPFIKRNFKSLNFLNDKDLSKLRWTLDTIEDYNNLNKMFLNKKIKPSTSWKRILKRA